MPARFLCFRVEELRRLLDGGGGYPPVVGERLQWFLHFAENGSVSATCRQFQIARTTFYRWARRFNSNDLRTLEDVVVQPDGWRAQPARIALPSETGLGSESAYCPPPSGGNPLCPPPTVALGERQLGCASCTLRQQQWLRLKRVALVTSVLVNVAFLAAVFTTAYLEGRQTAASLRPISSVFQPQ